MRRAKRRWLTLISLAAGTLSASGCNLADQIAETVRLALSIADVWVS